MSISQSMKRIIKHPFRSKQNSENNSQSVKRNTEEPTLYKTKFQDHFSIKEKEHVNTHICTQEINHLVRPIRQRRWSSEGTLSDHIKGRVYPFEAQGHLGSWRSNLIQTSLHHNQIHSLTLIIRAW